MSKFIISVHTYNQVQPTNQPNPLTQDPDCQTPNPVLVLVKQLDYSNL